MMKPAAFIQARMSSHRLPGKVLKDLEGKPLLARVVDRLRKAREVRNVVVVTSVQKSDDAIAYYCRMQNIPCYRGPLEDVAKRLLDAAYSLHCDSFVRISADSPMIDPVLVDEAVRLFLDETRDLVTNVFERTFPKGESVEVLRVAALADAYERFEEPEDREHVTPYFYRHPDRFRIFSMKLQDENHAGTNLCVDDEQDFKRMEKVYHQLGPSAAEAGWQDVLKAMEIMTIKSELRAS